MGKKKPSTSGTTIQGGVSATTFIGHDQVNHYGYSAADVERLIEKVLGYLQAGACFTPRPDQKIEVTFNDERLVIEADAAQKLDKARSEPAYLLGITLNRLYQPWETFYVPLAGQVDVARCMPSFELPLSFQEIILPPPGSGPEAQLRVEQLADITAALGKHSAFIILGDPGSGKTTTLFKIALDQARSRLQKVPGRIPLFIRLSQQKGRPVFDFLQAEWEQRLDSSFKSAIASGRLLALVDGVNEIAREQRGAVLKEWSEFVQEYAGANQFVFSGRSQDYFEQLNLPRVIIQELDPPRISEYLQRYHAEGLQAALDDPENRLDELAANPFYLMLLTQAYREDQHNLANRGRLLDWFAQRLFLREQALNHSGWIEIDAQRRALSQLAFNMQKQGTGTTFEHAAAVAALPVSVRSHGEEHLIHPDTLFRHGRQATLLDPALEEDVRFYHHLLQEYFAALELLRRFAAGEDLSRIWQALRLATEMPPANVGEWDPLPPPPGTGWEVTTLLAVGLAGQLLPREHPTGRRHPGTPENLIEAVRKVNPALAGRALLEAGLEALHSLTLGGLSIALQTEDARLTALLVAAREDLKTELYSPTVHLRARIQAGDILGKLGDPRLEPIQIKGVTAILPEMVSFPAGRYRMGSKDDPDAFKSEMPYQDLDLPAFQIARRPVTNAEFACFIDAGGYKEEIFWQTELARRWLHGEKVAGGRLKTLLDNWQALQDNPNWQNNVRGIWSPSQIEAYEYIAGLTREQLIEEFSGNLQSKSRAEPAYWHDSEQNNPAQPVTDITWFEACAYCAWLQHLTGQPFALPPEPYWEAAARGPLMALPSPKRGGGGGEVNIYPWGREWQAERANTLEGRLTRPSPIGTYAAAGGVGPREMEDQAGNVWEWTASLYQPYPYQAEKVENMEAEGERALRGGSWNDDRRRARCAFRGRGVPDIFIDNVGFRLFSPG